MVESHRGLIGKLSQVGQRVTQGEWCPPMGWDEVCFRHWRAVLVLLWDMLSLRCYWDIQMDMQISLINEQRVRREMENGNINCGAVSMEKSASHWETATIPEHQPPEEEAGWCHNSDLTLLHRSLIVRLLGSRGYGFFISMSLPLHILPGQKKKKKNVNARMFI